MTLQIAFGFIVAAALCCVQVLHVRRVREQRRRLFTGSTHLLSDPRVQQDGLGYPVLIGAHRGHPVRVRVIVDGLALRKLPALWMVLEQQRTLYVDQPLDILLRPTGAEFFSPNSSFLYEQSAVPGFPSDARIASPEDGGGAPLSALETFIPFLSDPRVKELYVTGGGVRLLWLLAEGTQAHYRTTRRADFGAVRVGTADLDRLLDVLSGVGDTLDPHASRKSL